MQNLKDLKQDNSSEFKQSIFYHSLDSPYYILHNNYLTAYINTTKLNTSIDYKNSINIELATNNLNKYKVVYLPFIYKEVEVIVWKL